MSDNMRLVARVEDQFTGPLGKLKHGIVEVSDTTKKHTSAWRKDWDEARGGVTRFEGALNGVTPVLARLGVSGIGVALSIGGMASALGEFSLKTRGLSQTSKDIGLTVDQLRAFNALGERFGVTADTMTSAAKSFAGQMYEIKRQGSTYVELQAMNLAKLAEDLASSKSMEQAIQRGMEGLRAIPDSEVRRRVSRLLFGTDDIGLIASNLTGTVKGALGEVSQAIGKMDTETEQAAKNFQGHLSRIGEAAEKLKLKTIGPLLKGIVGLIDDYEKNGLAGNEQERATRRALSPLGGEGPTPRERLEGRRSSVQQQLDLLDRNPDAADYRRKRDRMVDELRRVGDELERLRQQGGGATLNPSSFGGPAVGGSLIQKAAWGGGGFGGFGGGSPGGFGGRGGAGFEAGYGNGPLGGGHGGSGGPGPLSGDAQGGPIGRAPGEAVRAPGGGGGGGERAGQFTAAPSEAAGKYRPQRKLTDRDLSDTVINKIAGEARLKTPGGADAVINNMFNRLGTRSWGPSQDLQDVATAPGQYAGYRRASQAEADFIRERIRAIASGGVPDNTNGSNAFRASWYRGPWWWRHGHKGKDIGGNTFAFEPNAPNGPYAPYPTPKSDMASGGPGGGQETAGDRDVPWYQRPRSNEPGKMSRLRDDELEVPGSGERPGDRMMRRFYGEGAPVAKGGKGSLHITLEGFPPGSKAKASMDDLFHDTKVERGRSQMDMI